MDGSPDPIGELRETLRENPVTWPSERRRRFPTADIRLPELLAHLDTRRRRGRNAIAPMLHSAGSFVGAAIATARIESHRTGRAADRAATQIVGALRASAELLSRSARWSVATAMRVRSRSAHRPAPTEPEPAGTAPDVVAVDDGPRRLRLEELERRQLEHRIEALGPDHPDVAVMLQLVAERCAARGAPDDALALYGRALRIQEAAFGLDSPALRPLLGDLAELELELGHDEDAVGHRARRERLEPRPTPADRLRLDGVLLSGTADKPNGVSRAN